MREEWKEVKLGDLVTTHKGYAFKSKWYQDTGVAIVRVSDFNENSISTDSLFYISSEIAENYEKYKLKDKDVVIQTVGSGPNNPLSIVGKVICVPSDLNDALLNQNAVKLLPLKSIDKRFLYYRLKDEHFKYYCLNHSKGGANQMSITLDSIKRFKFQLPPLKTQRKIASILSAYDDLIENNLKRIKLLEEQAQLTYEEWFVRFKFPGHETTKFDEETGLPVGWKKVKLTEVANMKFGYAFKASQFNSDGLGKPIIRIRNIPSSSTKDFTTEIVDKKYIVKQGDLLIGMDGEFYVNNWSGPEGYLVQRVCCITSNKEEYKGLITEAIRQPIRVFQASIDGATVAHLGKKHLDQISIIIPKDLNIDFFTYLLNEKINLSNQNQHLKEARDILLPRLMSGMIDVEKLEVGSLKYEVNDSLGMVAEDSKKHDKA